MSFSSTNFRSDACHLSSNKRSESSFRERFDPFLHHVSFTTIEIWTSMLAPFRVGKRFVRTSFFVYDSFRSSSFFFYTRFLSERLPLLFPSKVYSRSKDPFSTRFTTHRNEGFVKERNGKQEERSVWFGNDLGSSMARIEKECAYPRSISYERCRLTSKPGGVVSSERRWIPFLWEDPRTNFPL